MIAENILTLAMLILLQAVLGIDNLLYISLESKNAPPEKRKFVRRLGIGLAIFLRIALLFLLVSLVKMFQEPFAKVHGNGILEGEFSIHGIIVFVGGAFILYTAVKEIWHMLHYQDTDAEEETGKSKKETGKVIFMIIIMNLVFSFDSILSAMALSDVLWVMIVAIILGGLLMIWLADRVSAFLEKNRMFEILGLFVLFLVGVMLISEAGHLSHLQLFGTEITAMNKTTFYFIIAVLLVIDIVQNKYQKNISKSKKGKTKQKSN